MSSNPSAGQQSLASEARLLAPGDRSNYFGLPLPPGEIIAGKYRIEQLIGIGGVGFVVAATHVGLDDRVALKFLKPEFAVQQDAVTRFTIEARASFKIKNEHVARVLDVDTLANGTPFMVMELLEGQDLRSVLERHRAIAIDLAVDFALQACEALAAAHACQIVHRDIKPENLFVIESAENDQIKVLDFGISKVALTQQPMPARKTRATALTMMAVGTPPYMSPEQVRASNNLDARADIWSLGCVLYELITGCAPFERMSLMQSCAAVLEDEPLPLREACPDAPLELDQAVMRCLRKDPAERFQDASELARALAPFGKRYAHCADRCLELLVEGMRRSDPVFRQSEPPPLRRSDAPAPRVPTQQVPVDAQRPSLRFSPPAESPAPPVRRPTLNRAPIPGALDLLSVGPPNPVEQPTEQRIEHLAARPPEAEDASAADAVYVEPEDIELDFMPTHRKSRWTLLAVGALTALSATYLTVRRLDQEEPTSVHLTQPAESAPTSTTASAVTPGPSPSELPPSSAAAIVSPATGTTQPGTNEAAEVPHPVAAEASAASARGPLARSRGPRKQAAKPLVRNEEPDVGF